MNPGRMNELTMVKAQSPKAVVPNSYDKKRDDYGSSSKRDDYTSKRDDYTSSKRGSGGGVGADDYSGSLKRSAVGADDYSSSLKRSVADDYSSASKRTVDEYSSKRDEYISSKRGGGGDEYTSSKRSGADASYPSSKRDEYKREVEIRHVPSSSYHSNGGSGMNSSSFFPRHGQTAGGSSSKRYENASYGSDRQSGANSSGANWQMQGHSSHGSHSGHGHASHSGGGPSGMKSYASNGMSSNGGIPGGRQALKSDEHWRTTLASSGDRYDRTYNERSGPYGGGSGSSRPVSDRYGGQISSRYESKY